MRKAISILSALAMVATLAACGGNSAPSSSAPAPSAAPAASSEPAASEAAPAEAITLKFVEQMPEGHIMTDTLFHFADKVEELSNGSIKVERYAGGQLGDDTAMQEGVQMGTIDVIRAEFTTLVNFGAKKAAVTTLGR